MSYIFLSEATRGFVGLKENILGIFFVSFPETLIILIALFCALDAEEKIVSNLNSFFYDMFHVKHFICSLP